MVVLFLLLFSLLSAQGPDTLWTRTYGGSGRDWAKCVRETHDKGFIMVGTSASYPIGQFKIYQVKTDSMGNLDWDNVFGGSVEDCGGDAVRQTNDRGYIVLGGKDPDIGAIFLIKTDSAGNESWNKDIGVAGIDYGNDIQQTQDGGYIIAGSHAEDISIIKTDSSGNVIWSKSYGGVYRESGNSIQQTNDGGYIITGYTESFGAGSWDFYLLKTDSLGDTLWTKTYGGTGQDEGFCVEQTLDGGYVIAGRREYNLIKTDAHGDTLWTQWYFTPSVVRSVQQASDMGYVMAGYAVIGSNSSEAWIAKTDSLGAILWTRTFGGPNPDEAYSVQQTSDKGYIIGGWTSSFGAGDRDFWLIRLDSSSGLKTEYHPSERHARIALQIVPNPFTTVTNIRLLGASKNQKSNLTIYDASGRLVKTIKMETSTYELGADLVPGVYFLKATIGDHTETHKLIKIR